MWQELSDPALWIGERLVAGSLQGSVAILLAWAACRWIPRVPAALQAWIWWLVALKLAVALLPLPVIPLPLLPAPEARLSVPTSEQVALAGKAADSGSRTQDARERSIRGDWLGVVALAWVMGIAVHGTLFIVAAVEARRLVRRATPLAGGDLAPVTQVAGAIGLTRLPRVCESADVSVPQVVGFRDPVVILPAGDTGPSNSAEWRMAVGHELMHVRRRDVLLGCVPALAERLYFFHPLARLAAREYVMAREAACDAAVVRALDLRAHDYGRLLVRLGVAGSRSALAASSASASASCLRRRLDMLQHISSKTTSRLATATVAAVALLGLAPVQIVAQRPPAPPALPALPARPAPPAAPVNAAPTLPPLPPQPALAALEELLRIVESEVKALNAEPRSLDQQMAELNRQRDALGRQERELQRQIAQTNEAIERLKLTLRSAEEAVKKR